MIEVTLPFPPSANHVWRWFRGRGVVSAEGKRFREEVYWLLRAARVKPLKGPVIFHVEVHPPDRRRYDLDNRLKPLVDACQHGGCYDDDNQIVRIIAQKREPVPGGKAVVRIGPCPEAGARDQ
jgi:crossover junction endodeoxyribonuclease RusA